MKPQEVGISKSDSIGKIIKQQQIAGT